MKPYRTIEPIAPAAGGNIAPYAWVILSLAWITLMLSSADRVIWSTTASVAGRQLGLPPAKAISEFVAATQTGYLIALVLGSLATDWFGSRRVLSLTMLVLGCATFAFGWASSIWSGLAIQFCIGVGAAPVFANGMKLIATWFPAERRASAISLFMTALSAPVILVNLLAPIGIQHIGWRGNYRVVGAISLFAALACAMLLRSPQQQTLLHPASPTKRPDLRKLLGNRNYLWLATANMAGPWASFGFIIWANLLILDRFHLSLADAGKVTATFGVGGFLGMLSGGPVSEWLGFGRRRVAMAAQLSLAGLLLAIGGLHDLSLFRCMVPILGFVAYFYGPLVNTMIAEAAGEMAATGAGFATVFTFVAEGLQPLLVGHVYQATSSFLWVLCILSGGPAVAAFAVWRVREHQLSDERSDVPRHVERSR